MVARRAGPAGRSGTVNLGVRAPKPQQESRRRGWRSSRDRERLGPAVWIGGSILIAGVLGLMSVLL